MQTNQEEWEYIYTRKGEKEKNTYPFDLIVSWTKRNFSHFCTDEKKNLSALTLVVGGVIIYFI